MAQLATEEWDVELFPTSEAPPNTRLRSATVYSLGLRRPPGLDRSVRLRGVWPARRGAEALTYFWRKTFPQRLPRATVLERLIRWRRPDVIHSLETQQAGYLVLAARKRMGDSFPAWVHSTWGSDLHVFPQLDGHLARIEELLRRCDYHHADCERDILRARELGFAGQPFGVFPVGGGFDLEHMQSLRAPGPPSERRTIVLKGQHNWSGRAQVGLRAIELCADVLRGYRIEVLTAAPDVELAATLIARRTGLEITTHPDWLAYDDGLRIQGRARVSIGLGISDGSPLTMLEAMALGAFPIQSSPASTDEWLVQGRNGLVVHPEDPEEVAAALREAISDDELVEGAAAENLQIAQERLDENVIRPRVVERYRLVSERQRLPRSLTASPATA
jgi:glycosyltransferase involved in cell wall biosynthesis